ncbi:MAG: 4Fe-4S binding protein [Candidatus Saccharibacteria bacterium]
MSYLTFVQKHKVPDYFDPQQIFGGILAFDGEKCSRCGICASICPARSITDPGDVCEEKKSLPRLFDINGVTLCVACGCCMAACPKDAITTVRGFNTKYYFNKITQTPDLVYPKKY